MSRATTETRAASPAGDHTAAPLLRATGLGRVHARGGRRVEVLRDVDLTVDRGELLAVLGPSGSGKSTLLQLLAGIDRPSAGRVALLGVDYAERSEAQVAALRRRHLGIVLQDSGLVAALSARDNVRLPLLFAGRLDRSGEADRWLERLGLGDRADHFPRELSVGEMQRVAIARALVHGPALILADEPTGSLDGRASAEVFALLHGLCHDDGHAAVVATHDEAILAVADRVVRLRDGRAVEAAP